MSIKAIPQIPKEPEAELPINPPPLSTDQLLTLIASMQQQLLSAQQSAASANEKLAEAILETTKPREPVKTKKQLAEEENTRQEKIRENQLRDYQKAVKKVNEQNCVHIAGCSELSEQMDIAHRTSILWHRNDVGVDIGVCTVCQRIFRPSDAADTDGKTYTYWRKQPSFNKLSQAGFRTILDPVRAREQSYLHDTE